MQKNLEKMIELAENVNDDGIIKEIFEKYDKCCIIKSRHGTLEKNLLL